MKTFKLTLSKSKKYVLGCSYGPDSMFLLNALYKGGYHFYVAHVNYHKREVSNLEQNCLKEYCKERNIPFYTKDVFPEEVKGNFQTWAREVRYAFFKEVLEKEHADAVAIAHQQDDHLETFLIQNQRGGYYSYYGIKEETIINGIKVIRPMLSLSKKDIVEFNDSHDILYAIDLSNLSDDYTRNQYRNHYLSEITNKERQELLKQIDNKNKELSKLIKEASDTLKNRDYLTIDEVKKLDIDKYAFLLFELIKKENIYISLSIKQLWSLYKMASSKKANIEVKLNDEVSYFQEYGEIRILKKYKPYSYVIKTPSLFECNEFLIDLSNGGEDRNIGFNDYPLTIRCRKENDKYLIKDYYSDVNRLFLDWKMPLHLRDVWPLIVNKDDKVIYIPRYRKNYKDEHKTLFKISLK